LKSWAPRVAVGVAIALACTPIKPRESSSLPVNACPDHPCEAYAPPGGDGGPLSADAMVFPTCTAGTCAVQAEVPGVLVILVAVPDGSVFGAEVTVAMRFADLLKTKAQTVPDSGACSADCVYLPSVTQLLSGSYSVQAAVAFNLKSTLVSNSGPATILPVHVTYRALWPPDASSPADDALSEGLPIYPVVVQPPPQATPIGLQTYLQSGLTYERTILPDSPFDEEFPPDVHLVAPTNGDVQLNNPDVTTQTPTPMQPVTYPTFDLSRTDGRLDGWTVYLRDATTKRAISPVKPLTGTMTTEGGVVLPTNHVPPTDPMTPPQDALTNAELVVAPPAGTYPAEVFSPPGLHRTVVYAALPQRALVTGSVADPDGLPIAADLTFEATAIYAAQPMGVVDPVDGGLPADGSIDAGRTGKAFQPQPNFEFSVHASAQPDASGNSTFQVPQLPRGIYRVIIRPLDSASFASPAVGPALTIVDFDTGDGSGTDAGVPVGDGSATDPGAVPPLFVTVGFAPTVTGTATIADGRVLSGATVEALPVGCPNAIGGTGLKPKDTPSCMPRSAQATTAPDGSFALTLDPGDYVLRVEPADGTRLPWVSQPLSVSLPAQVNVVIPAPVHQHLQLADQGHNLVANAIVHVFMMPATGTAVEVARAITDVNGYFDVYLDPALP
jgi:hypothetical protein